MARPADNARGTRQPCARIGRRPLGWLAPGGLSPGSIDWTSTVGGRMYVRYMSDEADMLEQLRSRLAHLEARQRATGSTAEPGFWDRVVAASGQDRARDPGSKAAGGGSSAGRSRGPAPTGPGRARRLAPHSRAAVPVSGPWSEVSPAALESADPATVRWTSESDSEDPGWVAAVTARAEAAHAVGRGEAIGVSQPVPVMAEALVGMALHRHQEPELSRAAEWIATQRASLDVMLVNVIAELESRGAETPDGLSRTDWLRILDPTLSAGAARAFVRVGSVLTQPRWHGLRTLVATQQLTVAKAAQIIDFDERNAPVADREELDQALEDVTTQAQTLRPEELTTLIRHHAEQLRPPKDAEAVEEGRRQARGLWFSQPNATGMVTMRGTLDPEAAAVVKSAVDPLSVPCPTKDEHGHLLERDTRSPARRRADALVEAVARGVSAPDGIATTDKAKVVVLIDHETLVGQVRGTGRTLSGDVLSPEVVRQMACDAAIIPVVLGTKSEPLDVGRERRLVTRGLRLALIARDRGCSFPGCTMPPQWTDAHHVTHWSRGGHTSLLTTALLCRRHHTHVHRHDLTATVSAAGVAWHM